MTSFKKRFKCRRYNIHVNDVSFQAVTCTVAGVSISYSTLDYDNKSNRSGLEDIKLNIDKTERRTD